MEANSFTEAQESREIVDTTSLVLYQLTPRQPVPHQDVSQQLVVYQPDQPVPQQVLSQKVASQQLVLHQCDSAQDVFWASWVGMLLRSDALARGEVDIDGLVEAFKSFNHRHKSLYHEATDQYSSRPPPPVPAVSLAAVHSLGSWSRQARRFEVPFALVRGLGLCCCHRWRPTRSPHPTITPS